MAPVTKQILLTERKLTRVVVVVVVEHARVFTLCFLLADGWQYFAVRFRGPIVWWGMCESCARHKLTEIDDTWIEIVFSPCRHAVVSVAKPFFTFINVI